MLLSYWNRRHLAIGGGLPLLGFGTVLAHLRGGACQKGLAPPDRIAQVGFGDDGVAAEHGRRQVARQSHRFILRQPRAAEVSGGRPPQIGEEPAGAAGALHRAAPGLVERPKALALAVEDPRTIRRALSVALFDDPPEFAFEGQHAPFPVFRGPWPQPDYAGIEIHLVPL
jgi:hypothetical protein